MILLKNRIDDFNIRGVSEPFKFFGEHRLLELLPESQADLLLEGFRIRILHTLSLELDQIDPVLVVTEGERIGFG